MICEQESVNGLPAPAQEAMSANADDVVRLPSAHMAQLSVPDELADALGGSSDSRADVASGPPVGSFSTRSDCPFAGTRLGAERKPASSGEGIANRSRRHIDTGCSVAPWVPSGSAQRSVMMFSSARWRVRIRLPRGVSYSATVDIRLGHCNGEPKGLSDVDRRRHDPGSSDDGGDGH